MTGVMIFIGIALIVTIVTIGLFEVFYRRKTKNEKPDEVFDAILHHPAGKGLKSEEELNDDR